MCVRLVFAHFLSRRWKYVLDSSSHQNPVSCCCKYHRRERGNVPHVVQASTFKLLLWFHIFPRLKYQHSNKSGFQFRRRQTISIPFCKKSANSMTNRNQAAREPSWKLLQYLQSTTFTKLRLSVKFVVTSCSWESTYTYTALHSGARRGVKQT